MADKRKPSWTPADIVAWDYKPPKRKRGRPRVHADEAAKHRAWRERHNATYNARRRAQRRRQREEKARGADAPMPAPPDGAD